MLSTDQEHVRLHITPFNEDIYDRLIPPSLAGKVANLSLHAVQTFPERGFGFLDMPRAEAEKLKKKLNGLTLRGAKIRIEDAKKPTKRKSSDLGAVEDEAAARKKARTERKQKSAQGVLSGHRLDDSRHVKRAWTEEAKSKDKRSKSAAQDVHDRKLLFKTTVPPNLGTLESKTAIKDRKLRSKDDKKSVDGKSVVKEFANHRRSFAIGPGQADHAKPAVEYIDGQGWVDEDGRVVEAAVRSSRARPAASISTPTAAAVPEPREGGLGISFTNEPDAEDGSNESASEASDGSAAERHADISIKAEADIAEPREVHPFEALYKRPPDSARGDGKLSLAPLDTSFSFFGTSTEDKTAAEDVVSETYPQTPHTRQEFEWRAQRSAAPTPDTAAIDGRFGYPFGPDDDDDDEDDENDNDEQHEIQHLVSQSPTRQQDSIQAGPQPQPQQEESAFRKYFYEHRGENDRAWKKMRREAKKQERQRENRRLSRRVV